MSIILYDLNSLCPGKAWSPNTWKTRYCLNFKGVSYKTEWIEWPDIKSIYEKLGIQATSLHPDGSPRYTMPVIHDSSTGACISDSYLIAEYLDKTYPTAPQIFPHGTLGLQAPFEMSCVQHTRAMFPFVIPEICNKLTPVSQVVYIPEREKMYGMSMADFLPKGEAAVEGWNKFRDALGEIAGWFAKTDGPFMMGDTISWADFVVASHIGSSRTLWGEESQQWKDITSWHEGRWGKLIKELDRYTTIA